MTLAVLTPAALDAAMPMALVFDQAEGRILHSGRVIDKIAPNLVGQTLEDAVDLLHPAVPITPEAVLAHPGRRLAVRFRGATDEAAGPGTRLRAFAVPLEGGRAILDLSFGPDIARAVARHRLDAGDFSPIDPAVEILFLLEARDAVLRELARLSERLSDARDAAELKAQTDGLTGLPNRRALDHVLNRLMGGRAPRFGVMHLDLDHFKQVNDTLGHAAGDLVLERVAAILTEEVRLGDLVARIGGDEFVLVFPDCGDADLLVRIGERIIRRLEKPIPFGQEACRISGSAGVTLSAFYRDLDLERMLADADRALYDSKEAGRAQVSVARPETA
ncbi:MAG: GGDEF domain-containing protein [Pseudomonadota bacterium]